MALGALAITTGCGPRVIYEMAAADGGPTQMLADGAIVPAGDDGGPMPNGKWVDATGNLAGPIKEPKNDCGALEFLYLRADGAIVAGVEVTGLWVNTNGTTWTELGNTKTITPGRPSSVLYDPVDPKTVWLTMMRGAIYKATDGQTFAPLGDAYNIEAVSVDFGDPDRKTIIAASHEEARRAFLWNSTASAWDDIGKTLPATSRNSQFPLVIDASTFLMGCVGWGGTTSGIYRTTDSGKSWQLATVAGGNNLPLVTADGAIYWAGESENSIAKSTDHGKTWTQIVGEGQLVSTAKPSKLPDGRLVTLSSKNGAQYVIASEDDGATWKHISVELPFTAKGVVYHADRKALYVWHPYCSNDGKSYGIASYDFDHTKQ